MNTKKIIYYVATVLISLMLVAGGVRYFVDPLVGEVFMALGFPVWLIVPMGVAKLVGVATLWIKGVPGWLREWAYAGITFNLLLAFGAHIAVGDGEALPPLAGLILIITSRAMRGQTDSSE